MISAVTINRKEDTRTSTKDMKHGQIAVVRKGQGTILHGAILLCTYDGFVNLKNPGQTWTRGLDLINVDILPEGSTVTLTVGTVGLSDLEAKMLVNLRTGNLLLAIKEYRAATLQGLRESKVAVEEFRQKCWDDGTLPKTPQTRYPDGKYYPAYDTDGWRDPN